MDEVEALRKKLNNHLSLEPKNLSSADTLAISRELDMLMLDMYSMFGNPEGMGI